MNQNFSSEQLLKLCKKNEITESGLTKDELIAEMDQKFSQISDGTFEFTLAFNGTYYEAEGLANKLILRKLNDNLKRLYKDEQSNRRIIINQVSSILHDTCPFWILRTDISKFYESVDRGRIIDKLQGDSLLSYFSLWLVRKLFSNPILIDKPGLPRGICISSTLSEIYMRKFDKWVKSQEVYYYARFVDDIIVFSHKKTILEDINNTMNENLEKGLFKNILKTGIFNGNDMSSAKPMNYLGYQFVIKKKKIKRRTEKVVLISISKQKINKIKSRIIYSFLDFIKNNDFLLLEKRIKFLTGNYSIKSSQDGTDLRAGIYYNYVACNDESYSDFVELNRFFQKTLHSKQHSFGRKLTYKITTVQRDALTRYSFKHGFINKVYHPFSASELRTITNCWK